METCAQAGKQSYTEPSLEKREQLIEVVQYPGGSGVPD